MARGNFKKCRVLLGTNTNEGHYFILYYLTNIFKKQVRATFLLIKTNLWADFR